MRLHLGSPLEVILAAIADDVKPVAYASAAMLAFERAMRLIVDWQRHRAELRRLATTAEPTHLAQAEFNDLVTQINALRADGAVGESLSERTEAERGGVKRGSVEAAAGLRATVQLVEVTRLDE
jgi:hypothetical protein